jgi:hypothetical protein
LSTDQCARISFLVRTVGGSAPECTLNTGFGLFPQIFRDRIIRRAAARDEKEFTDDEMKVLTPISAAMLISRHLRIFFFDDPHTANARKRLEQKQARSLSELRGYMKFSKAHASAKKDGD